MRNKIKEMLILQDENQHTILFLLWNTRVVRWNERKTWAKEISTGSYGKPFLVWKSFDVKLSFRFMAFHSCTHILQAIWFVSIPAQGFKLKWTDTTHAYLITCKQIPRARYTTHTRYTDRTCLHNKNRNGGQRMKNKKLEILTRKNEGTSIRFWKKVFFLLFPRLPKQQDE